MRNRRKLQDARSAKVDRVLSVEKPLVARLGSSTSELIGILLTKLPTPLPDRLVGHSDATLSQEFFNITIAEAEAKVKPNRVRDDLLWEANPL